MKTGLCLGKYAPLHKGHQYVIEAALAEMDRVVVMIYDSPQVTPISLPVRAQWIRDLYPQVELIEAYDGPVEVGNDPELQRRHEDYILKTLNGRTVTHFYSSEFYGDHVSAALKAKNVQVDPGRHRHPISASQIRSNTYKYRQFVHPRVYRDLICNVVLLGAPSTGKSTLAEALANRFNTVWMPEYGREYWQQHQKERRLTTQQLVEIAQTHRVLEDERIQQANQFLFTDTNAITTLLFSLYYHHTAEPELYKFAEECRQRYSISLLCDTDIPYDDTWDRSGFMQRGQMQLQYIEYLNKNSITFSLLSGSEDTRIDRVNAILRDMQHKHFNKE